MPHRGSFWLFGVRDVLGGVCVSAGGVRWKGTVII